jgi:folate-binding protein YgfZ
VVADLYKLKLGDRTWLEMDGRLIDATRSGLEKYVFSEQVKFESRLGSLHEIALHGPEALAILKQVSDAAELRPLSSSPLTIAGVAGTVWRDDPAGAPGYHLILPAERAAQVWSALIEKFCPADEPHWPLHPVGWAAFNAARIEAGRPMFGIDFDDTILPAETGLMDRAVSLTKGCYLGQEIVARMHARGQLAKQIVGFRMEGDFLPLAGTAVYDEQSNAIGGVTSSTMSPILSDAAIGFALLKRPFNAIGTTLVIPAEGAMRKAKVVDLPFAKSNAG